MARNSSGTLSNKEVVSYAFGDVANNLSFLMTSTFLMVYMTDIAGVPAGIAGAIYGITKIWAGATDLFAGQMVDRFDTKWGRLRPWILFGSLPLAATFVLLFSTPAGLSETATIAWILLFDAAFQLCYSFVNIPYGSLSAAMTQNSVDRSRLSGGRAIAGAVTGVLLSAVVSPQFQDTTGDDVRLRFTITTLILAIIAIILYAICFKNTRERVQRAPGKIQLSSTLKMVRQNRPLIILCLGALFLLASIFTMNAVAVYYSRDVLGNAGWYTFLALSQSVGTVLVASLAPGITVRFGKRFGYLLCVVAIIVSFVLIYFVPPGGLVMALVAWFLIGIGQGGTNAFMFSMQADTVDYGEWNSGTRAEGGSYSILSFVRKCGQGLGGWLGGAIIGAFGYVAGAPTQTAEAVEGIRVANGIAPAILAVIAGLIIFRYPLTEARHAEIVEELNERRTQGAIKEVHGVDTGAIAVQPVGDSRTMRVTAPSRGNLPIITFFERDGAGMNEIAPRVAEALGVPYVGQMFTSDQIAEAAQQARRSQGGFDRWLREVSQSGTQDADIARGLDVSSDNQLAEENTRNILESVRDGGVITGRNATLVLSRAVGAFHVRLVAPIDTRVERVAHETGLSPEDARRRIESEERIRADMSQRLYNWDPNNDEYYDLVINTGTVTYEQVVEMIIGMYRSKYPESPVGDAGGGSGAGDAGEAGDARGGSTAADPGDRPE